MTDASVSEQRGYRVRTAAEARRLALALLRDWGLGSPETGLPEVDDRYHAWRIPVLDGGGARAGEVVIDARSGEARSDLSSRRNVLAARLGLVTPQSLHSHRELALPEGALEAPGIIVKGDAESALDAFPDGVAGLAFTSPPYYNARPEYAEWESYDGYLAKIGRVVAEVHRVLDEGRFLVMNTAPVLLRRQSRSHASKRIGVPFDLHGVIVGQGFDFIDDIVWLKPEGAGWATGRGRRFAADRNPLQYKAVPVTEYLMVYRKQTDRLIDWNIREQADHESVAASKIGDDYERTNVWRIKPASSPNHPAVFPLELADRVVRYYSFETDLVLDPFAGSGTTAVAAAAAGRRFAMVEVDDGYVESTKSRLAGAMGERAADVACVGTTPIDA